MRDELIYKERRKNGLKWLLGILLLSWGVKYYAEGGNSDGGISSIFIDNIDPVESVGIITPSVKNYEVEAITTTPPDTVSYDVRVFEKLSEAELEEISLVLQNQSEDHNEVFVSFYLPGMKVYQGEWATAHKGEPVKMMQ